MKKNRVIEETHQRALTADGRRHRLLRLLFVVWIVWVACAAYAYWSYNNVFQLFGPLPIGGNAPEYHLDRLPADKYGISIAIEHGVQGLPTAGRKDAFIRDLRNSNAAQPVEVDVLVLDRLEGRVVEFRGSTQDWFVGERHSFDRQTSFDNLVFLFDSIEFAGHPLESLRLKISLRTDNQSILGRRAFVFISGERDNGYYPMANIFYLFLSGLVLYGVTFLILYRTASTEDSAVARQQT